MLKILNLFIVIYLAACSCGQNTTNILEETCTPVPGLFIANRTREIECCDIVINEMYDFWATQRVYLSKTLATLESWKCPQMDKFCADRLLDFTDYTALVYDRFCDQDSLLEQCETVVTNALQASGNFRNVVLFDFATAPA